MIFYYFIYFVKYNNIISASCILTLKDKHREQCASLQSTEKEWQIKRKSL